MAEKTPTPHPGQPDWKTEFQAAKQGAALFELPGLDLLRVTGADHVDLLHRLSMNELRKLEPGEMLVNAFANASGKVLQAVFMIKRAQSIDLLTGFNQGQALAEWLEKYIFIEDVKIDILSKDYVPLLLVGPGAVEAVSTAVEPFRLTSVSWEGTAFEIARVDYLLPAGVLILAPREGVARVRSRLLAPNAGVQVVAAGSEALQVLRVEQGIPFPGHEIDGNTNPYECGLQQFINYNKGCYIGQEVIARLDTYDKVKYSYVGLSLENGVAPQVPAPIFSEAREVGRVTSVAPSLEVGKMNAIALIRKKALDAQQEFLIKTPKGEILASVRPFERADVAPIERN
ncbi:MAG: folate-binding protein [Calditrichaeota bacterium]|nr:MAG: folate-binding protein [Calditrichota bacterium]